MLCPRNRGRRRRPEPPRAGASPSTVPEAQAEWTGRLPGQPLFSNSSPRPSPHPDGLQGNHTQCLLGNTRLLS